MADDRVHIYDYQGNIINLDVTNSMQIFMDNAIANATNLISGGLGGHVIIHKDFQGKPQQIYIMDTDDVGTAVNVWRFSMNGLAHSKTGYGGPYTNIALTPDGQINASLITTGQLNADLLKNGTIIDATGQNFWNLITGQVQFSKDIKIGSNTFNQTINNLTNLANSVKDYTDTQLNDYSSTFNQIVSGLQGQIDGQIESWYYDYQPTLNNIPAINWETEEDKQKHNGDIFYWESTGYTYRFTKSGGVWQWKIIEDSQITRAIAAAHDAATIADQKKRIFTSVPYPPYDEGDLWVQGQSGDILRCKKSREIGESYVASDWEKASKYTDDSSFNNWVYSDFASIVSNLQTGIADSKISTWYQETDPSYEWDSIEEMQLHQGDIWFDSSEFIKKYYRWSGQRWEEIQAAPSDAFVEVVNEKADIYVNMDTPPSTAKSGDLWFRGPNYPILTFVNGQWVEYNKYTDDSELFDFIHGDYATSLQEVKNQIDKKAQTWYQSQRPDLQQEWTEDQKEKHIGDLWYDTNSGQTFRFSGVDWVKQDIPQEVFDKIDSKAQIFYNDPNDENQEYQHPSPPYNAGDLWVQGENGDILRCITDRTIDEQYYEEDWQYASKYGRLISLIQDQIDGKADTWYQEDRPDQYYQWTESQKAEHIGDLWYQPSTNIISVYTGTKWEPQTGGDIPQEIFDKIDGMSQIFTQVPPNTPSPPYYVDDIWIQGANGDMMKCIQARTAEEQYNAADWVKATKYDKGQDAINVIIDSSAGNIFINNVISTILRCYVYKGGVDITNDNNYTITYIWKKINILDGSQIQNWTPTSVALEPNAIRITNADVDSKAVFQCTVSIEEA